MSNTLSRFEKQFPFFFFRLGLFVFVQLLFCVAVSPPAFSSAEPEPLVDRQRLEGVVDDSPLARAGDKDAWDYLFGVLRRHTQAEIERQPILDVGFTELNRQPVEYRGRIVRISGKLLRCEFVPQRREASPFVETGPDDGTDDGPVGYYKSWVLVRDQKHIPVAVCSLEIPDGFFTGDNLNEQVTVTGFFYKRQLYLSDKEEEVITPTLLARSFDWTPAPPEKPTAKTKNPARTGFIATLLTLVLLWLVFRIMSRRYDARRRDRTPIRFNWNRDDTQETEDGKEESKTSIADNQATTVVTPNPDKPGAMLFLVVLLSAAAAAGQDREAPKNPIGPEFTKALLKMDELTGEMDELTWDTLGDENVPLDQLRGPVVEMLAGLIRNVPGSFLENGVTASLPAKDDIQSNLVKDPARYRGRAFRLYGHVVRVDEVPLNPVEQKNCRIPTAFRCRFRFDEKNEAEILCGFVPSEWKRNEPIRERAEATGIYIKRERNENGKAETDAVPNLFDNSVPFRPLLVAPRIKWHPDTFLGNLGFDVGSFEQVPPLKISDLKKKQLDVPASLELLSRNEIVRRAFKFTEADTTPFYGLLRAARATPPGRIEQEARAEMEKEEKKQVSAVELFNHPEKTRGKPVLLHGTAKRVMPTLVEDREVKELYGIDKYYQIYLYTDDSQGNPIVVCTTSLPDGMPSGTAPDFAERISVGAIPYKLWVYETEAKLDDGEGQKPSFAPLLVGRCPKWYPDEKKQGPMAADANDPRTAFTFGIFVVLILVWLFFRRFKSNKKIEFKLGKK